MSQPWESKLPASFAQRSMWAFALRYRTAHLNEMIIPWHVHGTLQVDAMAGALTDLVRRHPTLRSRLLYEKGQLYQLVMPSQPVPLVVEPIEGASQAARLQAALEAVNSETRQPIDIIAGPTLIARLLRLGPEDHVLCLYLHHAMCDGWSIQIMVRDLASFYQARLDGVPCELQPLKEQCVDVAQWEIATYDSGGFADEIRHWQAELQDLPPPIALPALGVRKGNRDWRADNVHLERPPEFMGALRELARQLRVSPFALFMAALAVLLRQRTGREDMLIGVPTLNRWSEQAMQFVGYATSMLPVRLRPQEAVPFDALCTRVHASIRKMLAYGRVPLEVLLRETALAPSGNTVFPIWCQFLEGGSAAPFESAGLTFHPLATARKSLLAELDVDMLGLDRGWRCEFAYRSSLFDAPMIRGLMDDYLSILGQVQQQPTGTVGALCSCLPA